MSVPRPGGRPISAAVLLAVAVALFTASAAGAGATLQAATDAQKKEAGESFQRGAKAFEAGSYEQALRDFETSYGAVASPNSHLMLARALVKLNRLGEAYRHFEETVTESQAAASLDKKYAAAGDAATVELQDLKTKVGTIQVTVSGAGPNDILEVEGRTIDRAHWGDPVIVAPGTVKVVLRSGDVGGESAKEVNVAAGATANVDLAPTMAPTAAPPSSEAHAELDTSKGMNKRTLAYIAGGVGVAGVLTFAIFGAMNNSKFGDLEDQCTDNVCPKDLESDADSGRTYQTVANVGLVVGVVGLGAGTVLYLLSNNDERAGASSASAPTRKKPARLPRVDVGLGWVNVAGSF
jgi:hypothetical protein